MQKTEITNDGKIILGKGCVASSYV